MNCEHPKVTAAIERTVIGEPVVLEANGVLEALRKRLRPVGYCGERWTNGGSVYMGGICPDCNRGWEFRVVKPA